MWALVKMVFHENERGTSISPILCNPLIVSILMLPLYLSVEGQNLQKSSLIVKSEHDDQSPKNKRDLYARSYD